jgi:hypothetical protein
LYRSRFEDAPVLGLEEKPLFERSSIPVVGCKTIEGVLGVDLGEEEGDGIVLKGR